MTIARVLIEAGASLGVRDRWGFSPLEEARRVSAGPVIEYFEACMACGIGAGAPEQRLNGNPSSGTVSRKPANDAKGATGGKVEERLSSVARFAVIWDDDLPSNGGGFTGR